MLQQASQVGIVKLKASIDIAVSSGIHGSIELNVSKIGLHKF
jgi:hypothetical protein